MPHPIPKYCSAMGCPRGVLQSARDLIPLPQSVQMLLEKNRFCHTQVGVHHIAEQKSATPDYCTRREYLEGDSPVKCPPRDSNVAPIPPAAPVPRVIKKAQNQHFSPIFRHIYVIITSMAHPTATKFSPSRSSRHGAQTPCWEFRCISSGFGDR